MRRKFALIVCALFPLAGLIRLGLSLVVICQFNGWWQFGGEAQVVVADTQRFIADAKTDLTELTPLSYFAFLMVMGAILSVGAIGQMRCKSWAFALIGLYLCCHAFLFLNFMTINPKVGLLVVALVLALFHAWANADTQTDRNPSSI